MDDLTSVMNQLSMTREFPEGFCIEISKTLQVAGKMFIGGLSYEISKQALVDYLSQFGEIIDFTVKTHPFSGLPRGFGFVLFTDSAAVDRVLQVKEHIVCGRRIELRRAKVLESKPHRKIFVGGLSPRLSEENIREYFGTFGAIEKIELPVCPRTNERRAFCFISFAEEATVRKVLESRYHFIGSGRCEVKSAFKNENLRQIQKGEGNVLYAGLSAPWGVPALPPTLNAGRVEPNVFGAVGGARSASTTLAPITFSGLTSADQKYGDFYKSTSHQPDFNSYSGQYFLGCNYGTPATGTACTTYNAQANEAAASGSGCQGNYQLF